MERVRIDLRLIAVTGLAIAVFFTAPYVLNWGGGVSPKPLATAEAKLASVEAEATQEATVRISAKRLADGRTELGLQVQADGEWSAQRLLPAGRYLPANARAGVWSRTSPLDLDSGHVVRIAAQALENGQIEVGLWEVVDEEQSERMLPATRLVPRAPEVDRWLNSSPLVLPDPNPAPRYAPVVGTSGWGSAAVEFSSWYDDEGVHTWVNSGVASEGAVNGSLYLTQACWNSHDRRLQIDGLPGSASSMAVMTEEDLNLVEVDLTIDDGEAETQYWRLLSADRQQVVSADEHASELLGRLRVATSLTASVVGSGLPPATFDLRGMFDTRVQGNIDNCGNYAEPAWYPVTEEQVGWTDDGVHYTISYPDWLDGIRRTVVWIGSKGNSVGPAGRQTGLWIDCRGQGGRTYEIHGLPPRSDGEYRAKLRVDGRQWTDATLQIWTTDSDFTYTHPSLDYEELRDGTTLELEILLDPVVRVSFDLTALFDTPVQTNIDNCDAPLWLQQATYVPIVARGAASSSLSYGVDMLQNGQIHSWIRNLVPVAGARNDHLSINIGCGTEGNPYVHFGWFEDTESDRLDVTLAIDGRESAPEPWRTIQWVEATRSSSAVQSPESARLIARLRGASSVTVTIDGSGLPPATFDLQGMFDTLIQANIDECGYYKPGETREPPPELNTSGQTQGVNGEATSIDWNRQQAAGSVPETAIWESVMSESGGPFPLALQAYCGLAGPRLTLVGSRLADLGGDVWVEWSVDRAPAVVDLWALHMVGQFGFLTPADPPGVIAQWRNGEVLDLEIRVSKPIRQRFDLGAMFNAPVVDSLDQCLSRPLPTWDTPVEGIETTVEENVVYVADERWSPWTATLLRLQVPIDAAGDSTGSTSSRLDVTCGIEGIGVVVSGIGLVQGVSISGDAVDVTWMVGNGLPQTSTWDAWSPPTGNGTYSISPQDDAAFFTAINDAESLSVSVTSDPIFNETYDFAGNGFWSTPVQPNLDACGGS